MKIPAQILKNTNHLPMKKILIATTKPFAKEAVNLITDIFTEAGYSTQLLEKYSNENELKEAVKDVDGLIVRSDIINGQVVENASNLKIVVRAGAGYDNIDLEGCAAKNITVMNTPGQNANAVAELVFGMMLQLLRNGFNGTAGTELRNKKLGIHAYGHVGRIVGMIGKGFGMKVYAYDPFIDKVIIENDGVKYEANVAEMYSKCQYISLHLPLSKETRESIDGKLLLSMPENAMLVNTARKELINEADLIRTFSERPDFRYASDIEPDCKPQLEKDFPGRSFFTAKKMGAQTYEANVNAGVAAARQIVNFFEKGDTTYKVN